MWLIPYTTLPFITNMDTNSYHYILNRRQNLQQIYFPSPQISEPGKGYISPSYSIEIDFKDPRSEKSSISSKPSDPGMSTNNLEQEAVQLKKEPELLNILREPSTTTTTQGYIQETPSSSPPLPIFRFPSRLPTEDLTSFPVQPTSLTVQTSPPNPLPVLPNQYLQYLATLF